MAFLEKADGSSANLSEIAYDSHHSNLMKTWRMLVFGGDQNYLIWSAYHAAFADLKDNLDRFVSEYRSGHGA